MTSPAPATIVLDPSGAAPLCPALGLYLKPIARVSISVSLPPLPSSPTSSPTSSRGRAVSNWEVMERLKAMAAGAGPATSLPGAVTSLPASPFAALRLARSSQQAVRFEGELEHRGLVPACLARLDGRAIKLSGVAQALRVRAAEAPPPAPPTPRTAGSDQPGSGSEPGSDGEPYDTIHLQGLPCRWFAPRGAHPGVANPTRGHGGQPSGAPSGVSSNSGVIGGVTNPRGHGAQASPAPNPAKTGSGSTNPGAVPGASGDVIPCDVISGDVITRDVIARDVITRDDVITHDDAVGPGVHEAGGGGGDVDPGVHDDGADPAMTPTPGSGVAAGVTLGSGVTAAGSGVASERPSEAILRQAFGAFGAIRRVDIPMLDPYRGETTGSAGSGVTGVTGVTVGSGVAGVAGPLGFGPGGPLLFEAFVQFRDPAGCARAMAALRGVKLMLRGEDGKAAACNFKVTLDATRHLSDAAIRRRQLERQKLRELELQREEQKRREREAEARARAEER
nr:A-kinase anchor protein 17A-like [Peromyscus maniculatus bairdii]